MRVTVRADGFLIEGDELTAEQKAALAKELESRRDKIEQEIFETMMMGFPPHKEGLK